MRIFRNNILLRKVLQKYTFGKSIAKIYFWKKYQIKSIRLVFHRVAFASVLMDATNIPTENISGQKDMYII